ncbi:hypothetical protein GCM10022269_11180 [Sphingorhabdus rigui]
MYPAPKGGLKSKRYAVCEGKGRPLVPLILVTGSRSGLLGAVKGRIGCVLRYVSSDQPRAD